MNYWHEILWFMKRTAFTLIELLVVIATIAILASLLLPVLGKAKAHALATQCMSNQKQLYFGWKQYCDDSNDRLPFAHGTGSDTWCPVKDYMWWLPEDTTDLSPLRAYGLVSGKVWKCPAYSYDRGRVDCALSMAMNLFIGSWEGGDTDLGLTYYHKLSAIPPKLFLLTDTQSETAQVGFCLFDTATSINHNGGAAFVFVDGHSELHHWKIPLDTYWLPERTSVPTK